MKLIFCPECTDIFKLHSQIKFCNCGKSSGRYEEENDVVIFGNSVPIGISNASFEKAFRLYQTGNTTSKRSFDSFFFQKDLPDQIKRHE